MKKKKKPSPAYQLLELVWDETPRGSWTRLNESMQEAMKLAISAKIAFAPVDFRGAMVEFRGGHWFDSEGFYALAAKAGNLSAAKAFEAWKRRSPFIADDVDNRKRGRLAIGCTFPWKGHRVIVTSFADDGSYLTACSYHKREANDYSNKVANRFKITVAGIRAERALCRERKRLYARLGKVRDNGPMKRRLRQLGITTQAEWYAAPIETLRSVVKVSEEEVKA